MSSQGSHNATLDRPFLREHDIIDSDLEGGLVESARYSALSDYLHAVAAHAKSTLLGLSCALLPSFLSGLLRASNSSDAPNHTRYTSALDGLRGWACIAVMNYHLLWVYQPLVHYGYGLSQENLATCIQKPDAVMRNNSFLQLPIVRLLYSATGSVSVFFIVAGFVLAYKPLALSRECRWLDLYSSLASSTLRRGIRLYLPAIAATFCSLVTFRCGWWQYKGILTSWNQISTTEVSEPVIATQPTLLLQIRHWLQDLYMMMNVWTWAEYYPQYDAHLWTISSEFRASLVIFLTLPVYVTMRRPLQMILVLLIIFHAYIYYRWEVALFLSGILLADIAQQRQLKCKGKTQATCQPILLGSRPPGDPLWRVIVISLIQALLLILALYTLSAPDFCIDHTPGYRVLSRLIPQFDPAPHRFYPSFGAFLTVFLVSYNSPSWIVNRYLLNSALPQYFGRISFSLYLVHGPLLHIMGYRLFAWVWSNTGRDGMLAYCAGFGIAYGVFFAVVVWVADIFWRAVDVRSVRFASWLERRVRVSLAEGRSL